MKNNKFGIVLTVMLALSMSIFAQSNLLQRGDGDLPWKKNFGGGNDDFYYSVTAVADGTVAVGYSQAGSFSNGEWIGVTGNGSDDAIIVKYDNNGNVVWKKNFGGNSNDRYYSVTAVADGIVAVGWSSVDSFGNGDWTSVTGKGGDDAIIVKYDNNGNVVWKKNFGGGDYDHYSSVTKVSDGIVAVGYSWNFGTGDWADVTGNGKKDAIIVKYDNDGDVVWKKNFGGIGYDDYWSVTAVGDGFVAAGSSYISSFGNGDWTDVTGKGDWDAITVKYDNDGNVVWKKNFGGSADNFYYSVTAIADGTVAVGYSNAGSFGNGDWIGVTGKGYSDAIIVMYDNNGNVVWKKNFGGNDHDYYNSVTVVSNGMVAVGYSQSGSFGNGDWIGVTGKGSRDAIIVRYEKNETFVPVTNIADVSTAATAGIPLTLTGTVEPSNATNQTIVWSVKDAGGTGAIISENIFNAISTGTAKITATIENGSAIGTDYTQDFDITVNTVGIAETTLAEISVYPNPTNGELIIENGKWKIENVEIFDMMGRKVQSLIFNVQDSDPELNSGLNFKPETLNCKTVINLSQFPFGIYFVRIQTENGIVTRKIVKM